MFRKIISLVLTFGLFFQQACFAQLAAELNLSGYLARMQSGMMVDKFRPVHLRYFDYDLTTHDFKVLVDKGDLEKGLSPQGTVPKEELEIQTKTLLEYFQVGLTLRNESFWVNLRPDSEDQIIDPYLAQTDVGKIMLETDLQLKKDTARLTSPETPEGKEYWNRLYKKAEELFGYDSVNIPTLTRPWIVPGEIIIHETDSSAYIYKATLKVMLEQDYLKDSLQYNFKDPRQKVLNEYSSELIRELIIPKLTKEVNSSKRYAQIRQVYYSLILSRWFKNKFADKKGLSPDFVDRINTQNLTNLTSKTPWSKTTYFNAYQKSFQDGEYNIKEPVYTPTGQVIRSYFSGGLAWQGINPKNGIVAASPIVPKMPGTVLLKGDSLGLREEVATGSPIKAKLEEIEEFLAQEPHPPKKITAPTLGVFFNEAGAKLVPITKFNNPELGISKFELQYEEGFISLIRATLRDEKGNLYVSPFGADNIYKFYGVGAEVELGSSKEIPKAKFISELEALRNQLKRGAAGSPIARLDSVDGIISVLDVLSQATDEQSKKSLKQTIEIIKPFGLNFYRGDEEKYSLSDAKEYLIFLRQQIVSLNEKVNNYLLKLSKGEKPHSVEERLFDKTLEELNSLYKAVDQMYASVIKLLPTEDKKEAVVKSNSSIQIPRVGFFLWDQRLGDPGLAGFKTQFYTDSREGKATMIAPLADELAQQRTWHCNFVTEDILAGYMEKLELDFRNYGRDYFIKEFKRIAVTYESASSAIQGQSPSIPEIGRTGTVPGEFGGIDFRSLPMTIKPMGSFEGLNLRLPQLSSSALTSFNVSEEIQQLNQMASSGIMPSGSRVQELVSAAWQKGELEEYQSEILTLLAEICKLQEGECCEASDELKVALVVANAV